MKYAALPKTVHLVFLWPSFCTLLLLNPRRLLIITYDKFKVFNYLPVPNFEQLIRQKKNRTANVNIHTTICPYSYYPARPQSLPDVCKALFF
jgi:hypothetical protein